MVELSSERLDAIFHALADSTRRAMLRSLTEREQSIGELAEPFQMSFAGASKHVKTLERAGLIQRRVEGRTHICRLDSHSLAAVSDWLQFYERFWQDRLDALERELSQQELSQSEQDSQLESPPPSTL